MPLHDWTDVGGATFPSAPLGGRTYRLPGAFLTSGTLPRYAESSSSRQRQFRRSASCPQSRRHKSR